MNERELIKGIARSLRRSHAEIGEYLGINQTSVSRMLNGDTVMRADRLAGMCESLGADLVVIRGKKRWYLHLKGGEIDVREDTGRIV